MLEMRGAGSGLRRSSGGLPGGRHARPASSDFCRRFHSLNLPCTAIMCLPGRLATSVMAFPEMPTRLALKKTTNLVLQAKPIPTSFVPAAVTVTVAF